MYSMLGSHVGGQ